mmetsp:Transcript_54468/g.151792  ORF Transcript_54468/g.151792 Transcript_54468/m.151792 type:complete len:110 (-) Transcript_54468:207-536(-)
MARGRRLIDQIGDLHRNLRRKRDGDLSLKQAAYSFGSLFGFIFLLQYFDLATLAILGVLGYIVYRYFQGAFDMPLDAEDSQMKHDEAQEDSTSKRPKIKTKSKSKGKRS